MKNIEKKFRKHSENALWGVFLKDLGQHSSKHICILSHDNGENLLKIEQFSNLSVYLWKTCLKMKSPDF